MTIPVDATALLAQLPIPTASPAASPRFDGGTAAVPLASLAQVGAEALRALYLELGPVERQVEGGHIFTAQAFRAAIAGMQALEELVQASPEDDPVRRAVHAVCGTRLASVSYEVPRWSAGRITQALHLRTCFLAAHQRLLMRTHFSGLDDAGVQADREAGAQGIGEVLMHWHRGKNDADPIGLAVEVAGAEVAGGDVSGIVAGDVVASRAELAALEGAVQAVLMQLSARTPGAAVTISAERLAGGLLRIAGAVAGERAGADAIAAGSARSQVAAAFWLERPEGAEAAGLVGERELEGGAVAWVCWPPLP